METHTLKTHNERAHKKTQACFCALVRVYSAQEPLKYSEALAIPRPFEQGRCSRQEKTKHP
jgi:hypothetical protein